MSITTGIGLALTEYEDSLYSLNASSCRDKPAACVLLVFDRDSDTGPIHHNPDTRRPSHLGYILDFWLEIHDGYHRDSRVYQYSNSGQHDI